MVKCVCSNCGKSNEYTQEEIDKVFPFSRETLICKKCKRVLSRNSWFVKNGI